MVNENAEKDHDTGLENKLSHNFRLGDITWVKYSGSSWWPAQVIDESCVGSKPKKKEKYDCLVRLYGTCEYLYVDPWKSKSEFEMMLKQENKSAMEAFREVLEKELSGVKSCSDFEDGYEEEAVNSKGGDTKGTSKKTSSRKARKQEGLKQQYNEEEDQNIGSNATTGSTRTRKGGRARQLSSTHDVIDKDYGGSSAEGSRNKKQHTEIKAMVRDILFKDIIDKEHDAEMAYVDEVINGICNATDSAIGGGCDASTKGGQGFKQSGSGVEGESSNVTQRRRDEATEDAFQVMSPKTVKGNTPSRGTTAMTPGQLSERQNRQNRIMQTLALIPPSGSPFGRNEEVAASRQKF